MKCQWDLNKAIAEARNQPLRAARKRGFSGSSAPSPALNITNSNTTAMANSQRTEKNFPEEIILDSSDEDESRPGNSIPSPILPPAKRQRRLISTDSEDEMAAPIKSPMSVSPPKSNSSVLPVQKPMSGQTSLNSKPSTSVQAPIQQKPSTTMQTSIQQKPSATIQAPIQQKPSTTMQTPIQQKPTIVQTPVIQKPSTTVQTPVQQKPSPSMQTVSSVPSSSTSDKTINVPQALSIKPVPASTSSASNEKTSSMPNLPKGLVLFQVSELESSNKKPEETSVNGNASNISSNANKSAQLVRIKTSNKAAVSSNPSSPPAPSSSSAQITSVSSSKTVNIPMGKGVSLTPVNQTSNVPKNPPKTKALSITPVNSVSSKDSSLRTKSPVNSSSSEEESYPKEKSMPNEQIKQKTKVIKVENDSNGKEKSSEVEQHHKLNMKKKASIQKQEKHSAKRKRFSSDDDDEEEYGNEDIYDSEDSDCEENLTSAHSAVLKFFQEASPEELGTIPGCSKKKIEAIINHRPFTKWIDLVCYFKYLIQLIGT